MLILDKAYPVSPEIEKTILNKLWPGLRTMVVSADSVPELVKEVNFICSANQKWSGWSPEGGITVVYDTVDVPMQKRAGGRFTQVVTACASVQFVILAGAIHEGRTIGRELCAPIQELQDKDLLAQYIGEWLKWQKGSKAS
jgi:hypothetical protein